MKALISILVIFISSIAFAEEWTEKEKWSMLNVVDDILACSSYYTIAGSGLEKLKDKKNAELAYAQSDALAQFAFIIAQDLDLKNEALVAKLDLTYKEQFESIDFDYSNIAILVQKYADNCKAWAEEKFVSRTEYWLKEYNKIFGNSTNKNILDDQMRGLIALEVAMFMRWHEEKQRAMIHSDHIQEIARRILERENFDYIDMDYAIIYTLALATGLDEIDEIRKSSGFDKQVDQFMKSIGITLEDLKY